MTEVMESQRFQIVVPDHIASVMKSCMTFSFEVINDSTNSASFYRMLRLRCTACSDRVIAKDSEDIESKNGQVEYERVCFEFSGRKTFYIHVGFDLAVVLLTLAVCVIGRNNLCIRPSGICPPHIQLDVRHNQNLSVFVYGALDHLIDDPHSDRFQLFLTFLFYSIGHIFPRCADIHCFSVTGSLRLFAPFFDVFCPFFLGFGTRISLDDER